MKSSVLQAKERQVEDIADKLSRSNLALITDYRGLKVSDMKVLRGRLRAVGAEITVAKNTLTRRAAERTGREAMVVDLEGPTAIAFAYEDPSVTTKAVQDYIRVARSPMKIRGGLLGTQHIGPEDVARLADLPTRDQLQARLGGTVMGPMASLVGVMNGLLSNLAYVLDERAKQMGGGAEAPASE